MKQYSSPHDRSKFTSIPVDRLPFGGVVTELVGQNNYGIIVSYTGVEVYFLRESLPNGTFDELYKGSDVRFDQIVGLLGPQALHVRLVS
ncbi:MAG: cold shock CspA family protein [Gammaproteobacteria bacterium]|jgi:cold shock CspA family protein